MTIKSKINLKKIWKFMHSLEGLETFTKSELNFTKGLCKRLGDVYDEPCGMLNTA